MAATGKAGGEEPGRGGVGLNGTTHVRASCTLLVAIKENQ